MFSIIGRLGGLAKAKKRGSFLAQVGAGQRRGFMAAMAADKKGRQKGKPAFEQSVRYKSLARKMASKKLFFTGKGRAMAEHPGRGAMPRKNK